MKILLACAGGMSSSIVAEAIIDEAKNQGQEEIVIDPTATESVEEDLKKNDYDLILLAPQVAYRKSYIDNLAEENGITVLPIKETEYNPMAAPKLYQQMKDSLN